MSTRSFGASWAALRSNSPCQHHARIRLLPVSHVQRAICSPVKIFAWRKPILAVLELIELSLNQRPRFLERCQRRLPLLFVLGKLSRSQLLNISAITESGMASGNTSLA